MTKRELLANGLNTASILLAGRNSVHTWWVGILGCGLFAWVFFGAQLYADVTLQVFFVATSVEGWRRWRARRAEGTIAHTGWPAVLLLAGLGAAVAAGYGLLLRHFTDAYAPFLDSVILAFSVLGQLLLMQRRIETWPCWVLVNTLAVPLYWRRDLHLTSLLYAFYWGNAWVSWRHWAAATARPARSASP